MPPFFLVLLFMSLLMAGALYMVGIPLPSYALQSLILLFLATSGLYYFLKKTKQQQPDIFPQLYLLTIAVKLLAYGAYLGLVIWDDRSGAFANVVFFLVVYVIFTVFEIAFLWRQLNR